jgi:hypothetical protein
VFPCVEVVEVRIVKLFLCVFIYTGIVVNVLFIFITAFLSFVSQLCYCKSLCLALRVFA